MGKPKTDMFTGIIESLGTVRDLVFENGGCHLRVVAPDIAGELSVGESVAVNGACLTVTSNDDQSCFFQLVPETLRCTHLGELQVGERVNLERALRMGDHIGGHMVQGHIDGVGSIAERLTQDPWVTLWITCPSELTKPMVAKGSVAVDGISLTIVAVNADRFSVALIPYTLAHTTLGFKGPGATVNVETDFMAKHILKFINMFQK